jgi:hypothetical protein
MKSDIVIGALAAGAICGLVPLVVGLIRNQTALAFGGLLACIAGGFVLGVILAVPLAILFVVLIVQRSKKAQTDTGYAGRQPSASARA